MSRRLLASYLTLAAIVLLALEIPLAIVFARSERQDLTRKVERDAVALASRFEGALESGNGLAQLRPQVDAYAKSTGGRVVVVRSDGQSVTDTSKQDDLGSFASRPEFIQALGRAPDAKATTATGIRHSATLGGDILFVAVPIAREGVVLGAVRITFPTSEVDSRVHRTWIILGALAVIVLCVSALVGLRFAQATVIPLARLERAADAAGAGDLTVRAPVEAPKGGDIIIEIAGRPASWRAGPKATSCSSRADRAEATVARETQGTSVPMMATRRAPRLKPSAKAAAMRCPRSPSG